MNIYMKPSALIVSSVLLLVAGEGVARADWAGWRGPDGNGRVEATNWFQKGAATVTVWKAQVGPGYTAPTIAGGRLFVAGNLDKRDVITCLDAESGALVWTNGYACDAGGHAGPRSCPVVDGKLVFFASRDAKVFAFDRLNGELRWRRDFKADNNYGIPQWGVSGAPLVLGERLILNLGKYGLVLDKATGKTVWASPAGICGYATPVPFKTGTRSMIALFGSDALLGVELQDGKLAWQYPWKTSYDVNAADPVFLDGRIFISSGYGHGCALLDCRGATPVKLWENKNLKSHFSSPVLYKGHFYGVDGSPGKGALTCMNAETGVVVWQAAGTGFGSLIMVNETIVYLSEKGELILAAASTQGYQEQFRAKFLDDTCWTAPVFSDGRFYLRNEKGALVCVDLRGKN